MEPGIREIRVAVVHERPLTPDREDESVKRRNELPAAVDQGRRAVRENRQFEFVDFVFDHRDASVEPVFPETAAPVVLQRNNRFARGGDKAPLVVALHGGPVADKLPCVFVVGVVECDAAVFVGEITRGGTPRPVHVKLRALRGGARRECDAGGQEVVTHDAKS